MPFDHQFETFWNPCFKRKLITKQSTLSQMYSREYRGSVLLLAGHRWWCDSDYFPLSATSWDNTPLFCFYFTIIYKLPNASSPEHISFLFTVSDRRPDQSFVTDRAVIWIQPHASPAKGMIYQLLFCCSAFSVALSVWIYLLKWCHKQRCGIIHHLDRNNSYESVVMHLTDAGGSQQLGCDTWCQQRGLDCGIMRRLSAMMCVLRDSRTDCVMY